MALADIPAELILSARRGDRARTEQLLRLVAPDVYRIAYSMLRDHEDTDEVVQESLIRMFRYIGNLKDPERFASWVMRITVNQVQTWRMRKNRRRLYEMDEGLEPEQGAIVLSGTQGGNPREEAIRREIRREIEQAMAGLPDRQQMAVMLFEIEGCSIKEIAEAMACSEGAVKFNIHEARKKLQRKLGHLVHGLRQRAARRRAAGDS
ncbi:MAG TPA: RNA polymerase sigma factor [Candidatus Sumerlaeota bacterium]|nr:MAG: ECF RNA polymerase sigma factor SigE [candidate division BRC1 bacterium ADurb.BinA292]HOE97371.1 RNA polymerase sigma factor [Candidatus Sumerlaeota bacterium]HOR29214.1 RNA polymerase sigma factor [Candidatus Sumerlaeota bacterium]HPK03685.1 RNA polymerase sigma factor [Candidatus Sumerlaeota bacterium]